MHILQAVEYGPNRHTAQLSRRGGGTVGVICTQLKPWKFIPSWLHQQELLSRELLPVSTAGILSISGYMQVVDNYHNYSSCWVICLLVCVSGHWSALLDGRVVPRSGFSFHDKRSYSLETNHSDYSTLSVKRTSFYHFTFYRALPMCHTIYHMHVTIAKSFLKIKFFAIQKKLGICMKSWYIYFQT